MRWLWLIWLAAGCSHAVWRDMGDYAATYTTIEGKTLSLSHEYMGLPLGSESSSEVALCSTTGLSFETPSTERVNALETVNERIL
jgi:hypothetical protein